MHNDSLSSAFAASVKKNPDKVAVKFLNKTISYQQLDQRACQFAQFISRYISPDEKHPTLLFCLERSEFTIITMLACIKLGIAYVPFDPCTPDEHLNYVIDDCRPLLMIVSCKHAGRQNRCREIYVEDIPSGHHHVVTQPYPLFEQKIAAIMYTSGSTGKPKGVVITQRGILRLVCHASPFQFSEQAIIAQCSNIAFDASTLEIWGALLNGATLVIVPYETVIDSQAFAAQLRSDRISDLWLTVALFNQLVSEDPAMFGSLNNVLTGGDALNPKTIQAVLSSATPPRALWNAYGQTENTVFTTLHRIVAADCLRDSIPIGCPVSGSQCYVLDAYLHPVKAGDIGELYVSGSGLASGYLNQPEKTAEAFLSNPFYQEEIQHTPQSASLLLYKTGDRVRRLADGALDFIDRMDNQVKIRGYRVEPGEVEHQLASLQDVSQAIVGVKNLNGQKQLIAWCVSELSAAEILRRLRQIVPAYMVPADLQTIERVPLTPNGKVDRKRLPAADFSSADSQKTLPQNDTERQLAAIWQQLLQKDRSYYRQDNFFAVGGHSLLVIRMINLIRHQLGVTLTVDDICNSESLAEPATLICGKSFASDDDEGQQIARDCELNMSRFVSAPDLEIKRLLLTGATGFLGIHLLSALQQRIPDATLYCLVRGEEGITRLQENARQYQLAIDPARIVCLNGNLDRPRLGLEASEWQILAGEIDAIYHCGAGINNQQRYDRLRATNVSSTLELLSLCTQGQMKKFFFISTLAAAQRQDNRILEKAIASKPPVKNGFVQTKWVCEKLLTQAFSRGLHGAIYRMGNMSGSTRNGISNVTSNHILKMIKGCLQQGIAPAWPGYRLDVSPVDLLTTLLVDSSLRRLSPDCAFNLGHITTYCWQMLLAMIAGSRYPLRFVDGDEWATKWVPQIGCDNALYPYKSFYQTPQSPVSEMIDHSLVAQAAYKIDKCKLLDTYLHFWLKSGFISDPAGPPAFCPITPAEAASSADNSAMVHQY
ncbi:MULTISPECIES: amino acid adenylation domain-containing SDR family oxidoreductase [unclassified Erwinia]|nr:MULTISPECIES: amino acid adenylation domain-containing SDR family oxidoreductase [unclassified Erwinia]